MARGGQCRRRGRQPHRHLEDFCAGGDEGSAIEQLGIIARVSGENDQPIVAETVKRAGDEGDGTVGVCTILEDGADQARAAGELAQALRLMNIRRGLLRYSVYWEELARTLTLIADLFDELGDTGAAARNRQAAQAIEAEANERTGDRNPEAR